MHNLAASFVLGYHGCSRDVGERLLRSTPFEASRNEYDWLGEGTYFWETNPDRALDWARQITRKESARKLELEPFVVGAVIDLGYCLDLISSNGSSAVRKAFAAMQRDAEMSGSVLPTNRGGEDMLGRYLDRAVIEYLHAMRREDNVPSFDTVRALFPEAKPLYPGAGFLEKTHIQICVRNPAMIKGVFRVPKSHFTE